MSRIGVVRSRVLFASALLSLLGATFWSAGSARACLVPAVPRDEAAPSDTQLGADLPGPRYLSGSTARRMLHFTFDDGPTAENTPRLLDALDRAGMKATFFFSTSRFASRERRNARALDLAREVARRGHEVGAHGF